MRTIGRLEKVSLRPGLALVAIALIGCAGAEAPPEEEEGTEMVSITAGHERLEGLILAAMALVRPDDRDFDDVSLNGPRACDPDADAGLVFSTMDRSWNDVPLEEGLAGLDAAGEAWSEQGFEVDVSRRDRPSAQQVLATTADGYEIIAGVSPPTEDGIARFTVGGGTPCLEPDAT